MLQWMSRSVKDVVDTYLNRVLSSSFSKLQKAWDGLLREKMPCAFVTLNLCHSEVLDWLTERTHITKHEPESGVVCEEQTWWTVIPLSNSLQESLFSFVKIAYFKKCSKTHDIITIQSACHAQTVVEVGILVPKALGWRRNDGLWGRESAVGPDSINIISRARPARGHDYRY